MAVPETKLPFGETTSTKDILFYPSHHFFLFQSCKYFLTLVWPTFAGATASAESDSSSNITEMFEKLIQPKGIEVSKISVEDTPARTFGVTGGSSHLEDLSSPTPRLSNISKCLDIPAF